MILRFRPALRPRFASLASISVRASTQARFPCLGARALHVTARDCSVDGFRKFAVAATLATALLVGVSMAEAKEKSKFRVSPEKSKDLCLLASQGNLNGLKALASDLKGEALRRQLDAACPGGWTPLHAAAVNGRVDVLEYLLEAGVDVNAKDHYSPAEGGVKERTLFSREINVATTSMIDFTALHYAVGFGHLAAAKVLLAHGADPSLTNDRGKTAADYCGLHRDPALVKAFRELFDNAQENFDEISRAKRLKFPLEEALRKAMVGQIMPILSVSAALRRRDNGWHDEDKPMVFLFLGSSGVGKTMLAKTVAHEQQSGKARGFVRLDMSEYGEQHSVARLVGAPPGYVGHEQGGQLTAMLKQHPDAVVLLDEVEKAHPEVLTLMLQVFDEGRLTDGQGQTIACPEAVFIMTSNLLQDEIRLASDLGYTLRPPPDEESKDLDTSSLQSPTLAQIARETAAFLKEVAQPKLKAHFKRDEFLGRINEMLVFHPFSDGDLASMVTLELAQWADRAHRRHDITLQWTPEVVGALSQGYSERYGFRSIKYEVQKKVVNLLAHAHERDQIGKNCTVKLDVDAHSSVIIKSIDKPHADTGSSLLGSLFGKSK